MAEISEAAREALLRIANYVMPKNGVGVTEVLEAIERHVQTAIDTALAARDAEVERLKLQMNRLVWLIEVEFEHDGGHIVADAKRLVAPIPPRPLLR